MVTLATTLWLISKRDKLEDHGAFLQSRLKQAGSPELAWQLILDGAPKEQRAYGLRTLGFDATNGSPMKLSSSVIVPAGVSKALPTGHKYSITADEHRELRTLVLNRVRQAYNDRDGRTWPIANQPEHIDGIASRAQLRKLLEANAGQRIKDLKPSHVPDEVVEAGLAFVDSLSVDGAQSESERAAQDTADWAGAWLAGHSLVRGRKDTPPDELEGTFHE